MTTKPTVSDSAAFTVGMPSVGIADVTTSTADEYLNLAPFIGKYVIITCEDAKHYVAACEATGNPTITLAAAATPTKYVGFPISADIPFHCVPSRDFPRLIVRTATGTGKIRVHLA